MTRRTGVTGPPASYLAAGGWPHGEAVADAPSFVEHCQEIARRLSIAMETRSISSVADEAELARSTLHDILSGNTWPDVITLAKLEHVLAVRLWPDGPAG